MTAEATLPSARTHTERFQAHVLVIDGHRLFAELLSAVLRTQPDLDCVARAFNEAEARRAFATLRPDVVVDRHGVAPDGGVGFATDLMRIEPDVRIVLVDEQARPGVLRAAARVGICAYLPKASPLEEILDAIRSSRVGTLIAPTDLVVRSFEDDLPPVPVGSELPPRELEVLRFLERGPGGPADLAPDGHLDPHRPRLREDPALQARRPHPARGGRERQASRPPALGQLTPPRLGDVMTSHHDRPTPHWLLALIAVLLAIPISVLVAGPASAHTKLVSSNPAEGAALPTAPQQIVLTFNEVPASVTSVRAQDTNGPLVALGDPVQNGATVTVSWPQDQAPGLFRLVYVLVSDDGDPVEGTLLFSYAASASGSSAATGSSGTATAPAVVDTGSTMWRAWLVGVGLVVLAALAVLLVSRRRHRAHVDLRTGEQRPAESSVV